MRMETRQLNSARDGREAIDLSVCVIGRNEARNLPRLLNSLARLHDIASFETIFVDSASQDQSVPIAKTGFDRVISLSGSPHLNASAARHVATLAARGTWVMYLDGDMALREEFLPVLQEWLAHRHTNSGLVGICWHQYPDGSAREMAIPGNRDGETCRAFGGAVILPRELVLAAGNWNPNLNAYEEIELYGRLRALGGEVSYRRVGFVDHHTARLSRIRLLIGSVVPFGSILGKKYYGAGQVVAASVRGRTFWAFVRVKSAPFVFAAGLLIALVAFLSGATLVGALILLLSLAQAIRSGGPFGPIVCLTWIPQVVLGVFKYSGTFHPQIAEDWQSSPRRSGT